MAWPTPPNNSSSDCWPGRRLTFVMRMSGMRDQPSARMGPLERDGARRRARAAAPQAYVRHADERHARPAIRAHGAVGARLAHRRRGLARSHVAGEQAIADDVSRLRGHAFIVEGERAEAGAVLRPRVANHVHDFGAVAQAAQLIEREEAHARVVGLAAQDAVELDGMADRLVDLQAQLRAVEDEVELALGALFGAVQRHGFFGDARGVPDQVPLVDQLVALKLMLRSKERLV